MGRPSLYKPEYCQLLVDMYNQPSTRVGKETFTTKNGTVIVKEVELPNKPVHVVDFCDKIGIYVGSFYRWLKEYPEFRDAYEHAKSYLERNLSDNALLNNYNAGFASLTAKNWLGWTDKTELTGKDGGPIKQEHTFDWSKVPDEELLPLVGVAEKYLKTL